MNPVVRCLNWSTNILSYGHLHPSMPTPRGRKLCLGVKTGGGGGGGEFGAGPLAAVTWKQDSDPKRVWMAGGVQVPCSAIVCHLDVEHASSAYSTRVCASCHRVFHILRAFQCNFFWRLHWCERQNKSHCAVSYPTADMYSSLWRRTCRR